MTQIPEIYRAGYEKAARLNPALAARYLRHTTAADPLADGVMQSIPGRSRTAPNSPLHQRRNEAG